MMAIKIANMCARITSTYMEFTLAFVFKPEFKNTFKFLLPLQVGDELQKGNIEHLFYATIYDIIQSVEK